MYKYFTHDNVIIILCSKSIEMIIIFFFYRITYTIFNFNNDRYFNTYFMQLIRAYYKNAKYIIRLFFIESLTFN